MHYIYDIDQVLSIVIFLWLRGFPIRVHIAELISHDHELKYLLGGVVWHVIDQSVYIK